MPQDDASLGHRVTLFTTNHQENSANGRDASRIVLPVSLGHSREPNGKWSSRGRQDVTGYSPAVIPEGSMRDFWLATTPLNRDIENGRATQGRDIVESRNGRKAMQESIEQYMDPDKIHDHLTKAVDEIQASNDEVKRVGMACYEDLSNDKNFCHRRMIAEKLSKKIGVPIPDISHLKIFQEEKGQQKENPLKFYEDTILNPMRAIAAREKLDLSKDKDALAKIFEKELPDLGRLNAIIRHWDSQKEEPLAPASAPGAPSAPSAPAASPGVKEGIKGDITNPDFQKSGGYNMIVNTCNTVLNSAGVPVMGAGIAKDFRDKYKDTDYLDAVAGYLYQRNMTVAAAQRAFGAKWTHVDPAPGSVFVHQPKKADGTPVGPPIASLFVKRHFRDQARRDDTNGAITALKEYLDNNPSPDGGPWKVAMPHISGLNGERGNPVEGSVGSTDGWEATRKHIIDTFDGSPHEAHIIDFDSGTQPASASLSGPVMPFDQRSGVTSIQKTLSHSSVQDPAFLRILQGTDWQKQFFDSVNAGKYSAYLTDLKTRNRYTPEQIAAISLKIRQANIDDLKRKKGTEDLYSGARIADDGSTVLFDNPETMERLKASEPTLKRVMVSNHGIYLESEKPKRTNPLQLVRENLQYNHYRDGDGRKLYQQTKRVNYAEYEPGLWYSDIKSYSPGTPSR